MSFITADRVKETSTSTGTGDFTLAGAVAAFRAFSAVCAVGDVVPYAIVGQTGTDWEVGIGVYSAANTLLRAFVQSSSNANALVAFGAGTKDVWVNHNADGLNQGDLKNTTVQSVYGSSTNVINTYGTASTAGGTATAPAAEAVTNAYTLLRKIEYLVTTAATTAIAFVRVNTTSYSVGGVAAGKGGFYCELVGGPATGVATATNRFFMGMKNSVANPTDVEPSTITNIVGMGWDAADANIQLMIRGAGAVTKVDLGASFPVPTVDRTTVYRLCLFSPPGTTQIVYWQLTNMTTGAATNGTITTNLPTTTTLLAPTVTFSVGGTSSVIGLGLGYLYCEGKK